MHPHLHPRKECIDLDMLNHYVVFSSLAPVTKTGCRFVKDDPVFSQFTVLHRTNAYLSQTTWCCLQPIHVAAQDRDAGGANLSDFVFRHLVLVHRTSDQLADQGVSKAVVKL